MPKNFTAAYSVFPFCCRKKEYGRYECQAKARRGHQVLLLFCVGGSTKGEGTSGGFIPPHDGNGKLHMAFSIATEELDAWRKQLAENGVEIESEVQANNGRSLYFRDLDGHLIELATPGLWDVDRD